MAVTMSARDAGATSRGNTTVEALVISCEHGGNLIPEPYRDFFAGHQSLLATHRGFDSGALVMARSLAAAFSAPLVYSEVSRLLVDLNRSTNHPRLHIEAIRKAPASLRGEILARYYQPYRSEAERLVMRAIESGGRVVHVSSHSFTPQLDGVIRNADIGLLYDPVRAGEVALCARWKAALKACAPELTVRRNYPYAGKGDGLTAWFRKRLPPDRYVGVELELNQKLAAGPEPTWSALRQAIVESLRVAKEADASGVIS